VRPCRLLESLQASIAALEPAIQAAAPPAPAAAAPPAPVAPPPEPAAAVQAAIPLIAANAKPRTKQGKSAAEKQMRGKSAAERLKDLDVFNSPPTSPHPPAHVVLVIGCRKSKQKMQWLRLRLMTSFYLSLCDWMTSLCTSDSRTSPHLSGLGAILKIAMLTLGRGAACRR